MHKTSKIQRIFLILFGLFLCVVLLEAGLRLGGFIFSSLQEYRNIISIKQKGTYRIMCLGESTSVMPLGEDSYPHQLEEVLNQGDTGIRFSVINKGIPAATTSIILGRLKVFLDKYEPDMVITMMGINDGKDTIAYEDIPVKKSTLFLKSFRTYKLARLLGLHIINKAQELGIYKPKENISAEVSNLMQPSNFKERERTLKKAIAIDPNNYQAYVRLGWLYREQGKHIKAEEKLKKAIEINPKNDWPYLKLGQLYRHLRKYIKAEDILKKAIEINPKNYWAYLELGRLYMYRGEYIEAEEKLKKAVETNPKGHRSYLELGRLYKDKGNYPQAEDILKKAIEINPENDGAYIELGWLYMDQEKYIEAEEILKKAIEISPEEDNLYGILSHCYKAWGKYRLAEEYSRKANRLRLKYYSPTTRHNYQKLKEILTQREIKLVCVQYPLRSVESLKKMFKDKEDIILVDNETVFKNALKQGRLRDYFTDMFAGDFGHCTCKGNRLLAENIAGVILKECLKK